MKKKISIIFVLMVGIIILIYIYRINYIENIVGVYPHTEKSEYFFPFNGDKHIIAEISTKDDIDIIKSFYKKSLWFEGEWKLVGESGNFMQFSKFIQDNPGGSPIRGRTYSLFVYLNQENDLVYIEIHYSYEDRLMGDM